MNIEENIFKKSKFIEDKAISYGFLKEDKFYKYTKDIMDNRFTINIFVNKEGKVTGKIYDKEFDNEEYTAYRVESNIGSFAKSVREEYENILIEIEKKCFKKQLFIYNQTNRIVELIKIKYKSKPNFEWDKYPGFATFKNNNTDKWYAIIMNITKEKLGEEDTTEVEIINVKVDSEKIEELIKIKGIYKAYHMNKKYWISIVLDDSLEDDLIMKYIEESYNYTCSNNSKEWIVPTNPKYFDIISYLDDKRIVPWKESKYLHNNDIIYVYVAAPYSAIMYKCRIIKDKDIEAEVLEKYDKETYSFNILKKYGVNSVRGPRHITKELSNYMNDNK